MTKYETEGGREGGSNGWKYINVLNTVKQSPAHTHTHTPHTDVCMHMVKINAGIGKYTGTHAPSCLYVVVFFYIIITTIIRHLYWTNCGGRPQIERASIDDSLKRQTLIADDLRCPSVLALDLSG